MPQIQACNNFLFVLRNEAETTIGGLLLPDSGLEKPHMGKIISIGDLVRDKRIKASKGKVCCFHKGVGFSMEFEGQEYLVLTDEQVIGIL